MHDCWETGFPLKPKNLKTFTQINLSERYSYAFWKDIVNDLNILPYKKRIEWRVIYLKDYHRNKFHSEKQASFELESMSFVY